MIFNLNKIMTEIESNFLERATGLLREVKDYIVSNKDWVFYFLNPLTEMSTPLKNIVEEYPDEWDAYVDFEITDFNGSSVKICINIDEGYEEPTRLNRFIYLPNFAESVERNKKLYGGKLNEIKIANLKEEIESCENRLAIKKAELNDLLNKEKQ